MCEKAPVKKSDILSKDAGQWPKSNLRTSLLHRCFFTHFVSTNQLSAFFMRGTLAGNGLNNKLKYLRFTRQLESSNWLVNIDFQTSFCKKSEINRKIHGPIIYFKGLKNHFKKEQKSFSLKETFSQWYALYKILGEAKIY